MSEFYCDRIARGIAIKCRVQCPQCQKQAEVDNYIKSIKQANNAAEYWRLRAQRAERLLETMQADIEQYKGTIINQKG